ncbi:unnamed protein product [Umbelopsis ramanniana]
MLGLHKPENVAGSAIPAILMGAFVAFGGVLYGYDTGTIGGILAMKEFVDTFGSIDAATGERIITSSTSSLVVSILSAGTFFGALSAGPLGDILGRRWGLIFAVFIVFNFGIILQMASSSIPLFVAGRFFAGFGVGIMSSLVPLYQSEALPKWIRGAVVACYQLAITIGLLIASIVDNATQDRPDSGAYRVPIAVQFAWGIIITVGMLMLPETPRYLIKKGDMEGAAKSLSRLRRLPTDHPELLEELEEIRANHEYELSLGESSYKDLFSNEGHLRKRLITGCLLQMLQQLTGINFIFYYGTTFFKSSGFSQPFLISLITNLVNVVSTFPGLYLVEKWGRRPLLLFGAIGMCVCQFIIAAVGVASTTLAASQALIAFVCFYIFFFACSWGPIAWVVTGEIFPLKVRSKGLSLTTASNWLLNWAIAYATPYMVDSGPGNANLGAKVFFVWGSACFICIAFSYFMIYETKNMTLEQVDELYDNVPVAWKSKGYVPTVTYAKQGHSEDEKPPVASDNDA